MMDFKEFLLEEEEEEEKRRDRSRSKRRAGDAPPPKSHPTLQKAVGIYRLVRASALSAKKKKDKTDADTTVRIAASTDLTNPTMKRLLELQISSAEATPGVASSTMGARKGRQLRRSAALSTKSQQASMYALNPGSNTSRSATGR